MFDSLKRYKGLLGGAVALVLLFVIYTVFFQDSGSDDLLTTESGSEVLTVDRELVSLLLELRSVDLEAEVLNNRTFKSLEDFSQTLQPESVGRDNPFLPF